VAPCVDLYVRLPELKREVVERFLSSHIDDWRRDDAWLEEDAVALLDAGLRDEKTGTVHYSSKTTDDAYEYVIVAFPTDGGVVLGLSLDLEDVPGGSVVSAHAPAVLVTLREETGARDGFYAVEHPPPLTAGEWHRVQADATRGVI
jgi:hypothetical protein